MGYNIIQNNNKLISIVIMVILTLIYIYTDSVQDNLYCNNSKCSVETKNIFGITISKQKFILSSTDHFIYDRCKGIDFHKSKHEYRAPLCIFAVNKYNQNSIQITKVPRRTTNRVERNVEVLNGFLKEKTGNIKYDFNN